MFQSFMITLREGIEAFLIVAISLSYLRKRGSQALISAVHWGVGVSIAVSIAAGYLFSMASNQALWEGVLAVVAAVLVGTLIVHMWRVARHLKKDIETRLETSAAKTGPAAWAGVFFFTLLMITREGMETALLLNTLVFQVGSVTMVVGALLGLLVAAGVAWMWSRYGHRINLARFMQVTAVFLMLFVVQLLLYGFHELIEAGVLPLSQAWHDATEPYGPEGRYGQMLSYALVLVPLGWLAFTLWRDRRRTEPASEAAPVLPSSHPS